MYFAYVLRRTRSYPREIPTASTRVAPSMAVIRSSMKKATPQFSKNSVQVLPLRRQHVAPMPTGYFPAMTWNSPTPFRRTFKLGSRGPKIGCVSPVTSGPPLGRACQTQCALCIWHYTAILIQVVAGKITVRTISGPLALSNATLGGLASAIPNLSYS